MQETITEYETIEKERTRTLCDNCGISDEESEMVTVAINPQQKIDSQEDVQLIKVFEDEKEATREMDEWMKHTREINSMGCNYGIARETTYDTVDMQASATADVCSSCVVDLFDVDIDSDEIEDIDVGDGELNIKTKKEYTTFFNRKITSMFGEEWARLQSGSWPSRIVLYPLFILGIAFDLLYGINNNYEHYYRMKGFIVSFLGATLWFSLLFALLFIIL